MTECPKCGVASVDGATDCAACGIVFEKFERRVRAVAESAPPPVAGPDLEEEATSGLVWWASAGLLTGLTAWTWSFARLPMGPAVMDSFLHLPDLIFHEAGHLIFSPFGRFMSVLGGSLLQFLVPVILAVSFGRQHQPFSAAVCAWWAGQNLMDLAPYIADARSLQLVLLGGKTGAEVEGHDWEYLLTQLGIVHHDRTVGLWTHYGGVLLMAAAIGGGAWTLRRRRNRSPALPSAS